MKKTLLLLTFGMFMLSLNGMAQNKNKKETFSWNKKYMNQLELGEDLQIKILKVNAEFKAEIKVIRDDEDLSKEEKREKIKSIARQKNKKINSLLSPDEKKRSIDLKKELRAKRENG